MKIVLFLFLFFLSYKQCCSYKVIGYSQDYMEFNMDDPYPRYFEYYEYDEKTLRNYPRFNLTCDPNAGTKGVCRIDLNEDMKKNLYGCLKVCLYSGSIFRGCTPTPTFPLSLNVVFKNKLPTSGGIVNIVGDYLRSNTADMSLVNGFANNDDLVLYFKVLTNSSDPLFDPRNITVEFTEGYGFIVVCFDRAYNEFSSGNPMYKLKYESPSISNVSYDGSIFTINGDNFYKDVSVITLKVNDVVINSSNINVVKPHKVLSVKYQQLYPAKLEFWIDVGGNSIEKVKDVYIRPQPNSIAPIQSTSKYNSGKIQINGSYLSSQDASISIVFLDMLKNKNYSCDVITNESNSNSILCILEKCDTSIDQVKTKLIVTINGVENNNTINFNYGVPSFSTNIKPSQNGSEFTVNGLNFGNLSDNSTKVLIDGQDKNVEIKSISDDETKLSFILPNTCNDQVNITIQVNGINSTKSIQITPDPVYFIYERPSTRNGTIEIRKYYSCNKISNATIIVDGLKSICKIDSTNTRILCNIGDGSGYHSFKLEVDGKIIMNSNFTYLQPSINNYKLDIQSDNKINVKLNGSNFGTSSADCIIKLDGVNNNCTVLNHETITFNISKFIDYNLQVIINGTSIDNTYLIKVFKLGKVIQSDLSSRNGSVCINGTNLPTDVSDYSINIKSNIKDGPSSYNRFNVSKDNITIYLNDGVGKFNVSINIKSVLTEVYNFRYDDHWIGSSFGEIRDNNKFLLFILGFNFGSTFNINITSSSSLPIENQTITQYCNFSKNTWSINSDHIIRLNEYGSSNTLKYEYNSSESLILDYYICEINTNTVNNIKSQHNVSLTIDDYTQYASIQIINGNGDGDDKSKVNTVAIVLPIVFGAGLVCAGVVCFIKKDQILKQIERLKLKTNKPNSNV